MSNFANKILKRVAEEEFTSGKIFLDSQASKCS